MPVIVGKSYPRTQTPVFVGTLKYVIFRPYWDIPHQITVQEVLPQWRAHADYLVRNHFEIVRGDALQRRTEPHPGGIGRAGQWGVAAAAATRGRQCAGRDQVRISQCP